MSANVHCPTCGTRWRHREAIGHCAACHHTFIGSTAFDRHQHLGDDGRPQCLEPGQVLRESGEAVFEAVPHSPQLESGVFWRLRQTQAQRQAHQRFIDRVSASRSECQSEEGSAGRTGGDWSLLKSGDLGLSERDAVAVLGALETARANRG